MEKNIITEGRISKYRESNYTMSIHSVNKMIAYKETLQSPYREIHPTPPRSTAYDAMDSFSKARRLNVDYHSSTKLHDLRETNSFGIPRYAIVEVFVLIAALVGSLVVFTFSTLLSPKIAYVFLIPLFSSVVGIIFVFAKRP